MHEHEFQFSMFVKVQENLVEKGLKGLHFRKEKETFLLEIEDIYFRIIPFKNQPRSSLNGYRCYFNGSVESAAYLLDMAFGWTEADVTGISCVIRNEEKTQEDWMEHLRNHVHCHMVNAKGVFRYKKTFITVLPKEVCLQIHAPKGKKLDTLKSLEEEDAV